ncbi:MAG: hypothetical protein WA797_05395 [Acidimicrobiales bacterium]
MEISSFQISMADTYGQRDRERGIASSMAWLVEEVGGTRSGQEEPAGTS